MNKRYIQSFRSVFLDPDNEKDELANISGIIPKRDARRMSSLGRMMTWVLNGIPLDLGMTVVYGTTYSEARALETYLGSFPYASPMAFQKSIHPSGIEQALILNKQEVGPFFPIAGDTDLLVNMLRFSFLNGSEKVLLCGGEESATWLGDYKCAWPNSYAFSMQLTTSPKGAIGKVTESSAKEDVSGPTPNLEECIRKLDESRQLHLKSRYHGNFTISLK